MRKRVSCAVTAAVLAVSLGLSGCSFSVKVGDKEITNRKETTAASTEETKEEEMSSAPKETHRSVGTEDETRPAPPETSAGYEAGSGGGSFVATHTAELTNGCKVFYDGVNQLQFDGAKPEFQLQTNDLLFHVGTMGDEEATMGAMGIALILHPDYLPQEYADALKEMDFEEDLDGVPNYIKGYSWLNDSSMVNVDCAEYSLTVEGETITLLTMFVGNDNNLAIAFNEACGINPKNVGFEVNGKTFMIADAKEEDMGKWGAMIFESVINEASGGSGSSGSGGFFTGDNGDTGVTQPAPEESSAAYVPAAGFNKVSAPSGWENTYTSDSSQVFSLPDWAAEVTLWEFKYYGGTDDKKLQAKTVSSEVYTVVTDYYTYYYFPVDEEHHIEVQLANDANTKQEYAEELYKTFHDLWVK